MQVVPRLGEAECRYVAGLTSHAIDKRFRLHGKVGTFYQYRQNDFIELQIYAKLDAALLDGVLVPKT